MVTGQKVSFKIYDDLFKDFVYGTGKVKSRLHGKLWTITPDENPRLSGRDLRLHENSIRKVA